MKSVNAMKRAAIVTGTSLAMFSIGASAATIDPGPGQYTFSGNASLSGSSITANCNLSLTGTVEKNGSGGVIVSVNEGSATNGLFCGAIDINFDNGPWTAEVQQSEIPNDPTAMVPVTFNNVQVSRLGIPCVSGGGPVVAMFGNGDPISNPSFFAFNDANFGQCSINGRVEAEMDVNVTQ